MPWGAPAPLDQPPMFWYRARDHTLSSPPGRPRISQLWRRPPVGAGGRQDGAGSDGSDGHAPAQQHETQYKAQNKAMV